jgi:DNA invertase Pin-like site-specific DNA recombinase
MMPTGAHGQVNTVTDDINRAYASVAVRRRNGRPPRAASRGHRQGEEAGVYTGAKQRSDRDRVLALIYAGSGPAAAARALGISRITIYRILGEHTKEPDHAMSRRKSAGRL